MNSVFNKSLFFLAIPIVLSAFTHLWNPLGFPHIFIDEGHYMRRTMIVLNGLGPQEPTDAYTMKYDHPYFGQLFLAGMLALIGYPGSLHPSTDGDMHSIEMLWLAPRVIMGILAVVDTFLIYKIAERIYNRNVALIASILFAVMPFTWLLRRLQLESILLPFLLSSILFAVYYRYADGTAKNTDKTNTFSRRKNILLIILSGVFLGIAIFTKIPASTMIPLIVFFIYTADRNSEVHTIVRAKPVCRFVKNLKPIGLWFIPVILIPLIWPTYNVLTGQFDDWFHGVMGWSQRVGLRGMIASMNEVFNIDPIFTIMAIAGLVFAAIKRYFFLLIGVIPFLVYFGLVGYVKNYYWDLVLPLFCIAAAVLITDVSKKVSCNKIMAQKMLPFVIISAIGMFGLVSTSMLITTNVNLAYFGQNSLIVQSLQYLKNSDSSHSRSLDSKITIVGTDYVGGFLWIPKYILGINHQFVKFSGLYLSNPITTTKVLLVLDRDSVKSISENKKGDKNQVLYLVYNSKNMGTFISKNMGTIAKIQVRAGNYINTGLKIVNGSGSISSLQNDQTGKPAWIVVGRWMMNVSQGGAMNLKSPSPNRNSAAFNATLNMVKLDGTAKHKHTISNFKLTSSSVNKKISSATFNGTATITLKEGPVKDVPISIKFLGINPSIDSNVSSMWIDPTKTQKHFGNTSIYSSVSRTH